MNDIDLYQEKTAETAVYPKAASTLYPILKLGEEVGELQSFYAGRIVEFGPRWSPQPGDVPHILGELGDMMWFISRIADHCGIAMSEVLAYNLDKLQRRKAAGTLMDKSGR